MTPFVIFRYLIYLLFIGDFFIIGKGKSMWDKKKMNKIEFREIV